MKVLILVGMIVAVVFAILTLSAVRPRKGQHHIVYLLDGKRDGYTTTGGWVANRWVVVTRDGADRQTVNIPWMLSFWAHPGTSVTLSARYLEKFADGRLEAKLFVDDHLLQSARSSGNESATISSTVP